MPSDFPALSELTRYVPAAGDPIALHLEDGTAERVVVQSAAGSHIVVRSVLRAEPGDALALVWRMTEGRARCDARVVAITGEELEIALGTVTVRETRRARRLAPTRRVTAAIHLADGSVVDGRLLDVSDGGGAVIVPVGAVHPGLVVHVAFASAWRSSGSSISHAYSAHDSGKLPRKNAVSTTTPRITPGMPSRTMHQS